MIGQQPQSTEHWRTPEVNLSLERIERRLGSLEAKLFLSKLTMGALREEEDLEANKARLNWVAISGVRIPGLSSMNALERLWAMKASAHEIFDLVKQDGREYEALFVRHLNKQGRDQTRSVIEVKLEDPELATNLRLDFVKKQEELDSNLYPGIQISPVYRLATRVRVEILHSVANLLKSQDATIVTAKCLQFLPKPIIKVVRKSAAGIKCGQTMTFIEAVCWVKENGYTNSIDLTRAYKKAGTKGGTQHFVIM